MIPAGFPARPIMIASEIYRASRYAKGHPLAIERVSPVVDLARALGWLDAAHYVDSPQASPAQLGRFHHPAYIAALMQAERSGVASPEVQQRYNIGCNGNPVFAEVFRRPATAAGASILAGTTLAACDSGTIFSPAGGTHHGRADRASGFCFVNDLVLAILAMRDGGLGRIYYIDLDAHHGDGVQDAFHDDDQVLTVSVHEAGRWPRTGPSEDRAGGMARNFPVPAGFNDSELRLIVETALLPLGAQFAPDALVIQCGADGLGDDPQSKLQLSNRALWGAVARLRPLAPRCLVLGGGGYNPFSVARAWTGIWATLNGIAPDVALVGKSEAVLRALDWSHRIGRNPPQHWFTQLADPPNEGPIRDTVQALVEEAMR